MVEEFTVKSFDSPDETVTFDNGRSERLQVGDRTFWLSTVEPGWRFSTDNAPEMDAERCPTPHRLYMVSGRMTVEMADGSSETLRDGDVAVIPPGHDAWVDGDERAVFFEEELDA